MKHTGITYLNVCSCITKNGIIFHERNIHFCTFYIAGKQSKLIHHTARDGITGNVDRTTNMDNIFKH